MCKTVQNYTVYNGFHLLAFSRYQQFQLFIFTGVFLMYLFCIMANLLVFIIVCLTPHLQTPMYFFLCNLTLLDVVYVTVILPKLLVITVTGDLSISYSGCYTQVFLYVFCIGTEFCLLTSMAYDRYVAICHPMHYNLIMNRKICLTLVIATCHLGTVNGLMYVLLLPRLSFSNCHEINHFFCHMKSILALATSDSTLTLIEILMMLIGVVIGPIFIILILTSYIYIIATIVKIRTSSGRHKAFSSCSSHLCIVLLFCLASLSLNMKNDSDLSREHTKLFSMLYIAVIPMLNPLVYSLRNKEVLRAIKKMYLKK